MRKIILISIVIVSFGSQLSAQVEKGQLYGDVLVGRKLFDYNTNTIQPSFSIGLSEKSTFGVFYSRTRFNSMPSISYKGHAIQDAIGISYTYYHYFPKSKKWGWYLDGSLSSSRIRVYDKWPGFTVLNNRYTEREFKVTPGIFFKPSNRVMLFANIGGFSLLNNQYESLRARTSFAGQLNIGVKISMGKPKGKKNR